MKRTLYIHIGHAKCGSSTIQRFLSENRLQLLKFNFLYPQTFSSTFHSEISPVFWKNARLDDRSEGYLNTIMDEIYSVNHKLPEALIRSICGLMMFSGDNAKKKISLLSGGEKSRVMLGKIIAQDVNLLFLDEPTNHLDIDSIDALTNAIKAFEGSCLIVTHSEELLRAVCDRLIVFTEDLRCLLKQL